MSRIGKLPIQVPAGVTIAVAEDNTVSVKGPKGVLYQKVHQDIKIEEGAEALNVTRPSDNKAHRSMHGLYRTLVNNMVVGVTAGFQKTLLIEGVGYRAQTDGKKLTLNLGYSHPVEFSAPDNITFEAPAPTRVLVKGIDKQLVGAIAADIRKARQVEPYHGKGIRYEGERVRRKEGKAGKK
jgi:large subunit ribosomal protein L6